MKSFFKLLSVPVLLIAGGIWIHAIYIHRLQVQHASAALESSGPEGDQTDFDKVANPGLPLPSFEWNQLESTNYLVYIANLRRIKCPEQTIRDLISAEVAAMYSKRQAVIEQQLDTASTSGLLTSWRDAEQKLRELRKEQARLVENLMYPERSTPDASGKESVVAGETVGNTQPVTPLFLRSPREKLELDNEQMEAFNDVRDWFLKQIGGTNQDPSDPAYFERWQLAQPRADELLKESLGPYTFMRFRASLLEDEEPAVQ